MGIPNVSKSSVPYAPRTASVVKMPITTKGVSPLNLDDAVGQTQNPVSGSSAPRDSKGKPRKRPPSSHPVVRTLRTRASRLSSRSIFSQFRSAVERLAAQLVCSSTSQTSDTSNVMSRTSSSESGVPSPTQLADSALSSIRQSIQAQLPSSLARAGPSGMTNRGVHDHSQPRSRLEERLPVSLSFGIGEVSNPSTAVSTNPANTPISAESPAPSPGIDTTPLSPTLIPLPNDGDSPRTTRSSTIGCGKFHCYQSPECQSRVQPVKEGLSCKLSSNCSTPLSMIGVMKSLTEGSFARKWNTQKPLVSTMSTSCSGTSRVSHGSC